MILEILWCSVAAAGLARAVWHLREAIYDRRAVEPDPDGKKTVANGQVEHAAMGLAFYAQYLGAGAIALAYKLGMTSLEDRLDLVAYLIISGLVTLVIRQERDARYRKLALDLPPGEARLGIRRFLRLLKAPRHRR